MNSATKIALFKKQHETRRAALAQSARLCVRGSTLEPPHDHTRLPRCASLAPAAPADACGAALSTTTGFAPPSSGVAGLSPPSSPSPSLSSLSLDSDLTAPLALPPAHFPSALSWVTGRFLNGPAAAIAPRG